MMFHAMDVLKINAYIVHCKCHHFYPQKVFLEMWIKSLFDIANSEEYVLTRSKLKRRLHQVLARDVK